MNKYPKKVSIRSYKKGNGMVKSATEWWISNENGESATRNGESAMTEWRIGDGMVKSRTRNGELTTTKCRIGEGMVNQQRWNGESAMRNGELVTEGWIGNDDWWISDGTVNLRRLGSCLSSSFGLLLTGAIWVSLYQMGSNILGVNDWNKIGKGHIYR